MLRLCQACPAPQPITPPTDQDNPGLFEVPLNISSETVDGEYLIRLAGIDDKDGEFEDGSPANVGESKLVRVVLDQVDPIITRVELSKECRYRRSNC